MNHVRLTLLALGTLVLADLPVQAQPRRGRGEDASRYGWLSSLEEGTAQARKTGKPIMLVFRCVP